MIKFIRLGGICSIVIGVGCLIFALNLSYDQFISILIDLTNTPPSKKEKVIALISESKFELIKFSPLFCLIGGITVLFNLKKIDSRIQLFNSWLFSVKENFFKIPKRYLLVFIGIVLGSFILNLFHVIKMPISYDEAFTYINFTRKSLFASISWYPAPNNHILNSVLTNLTFELPFSQTVNLRLPSLIVSLITSISFYYICIKYLGNKTSLFLLICFCFSYPILIYSYQSRGYILVLFSFILCFYSTMQICYPTKEKYPKEKKYIRLLSFGAIIGFYSIPSFLYPYFTSISFVLINLILKKKYDTIVFLIKSQFIVGVVIICLYTPVFMISGIDSIIKNEFVVPLSRIEVLQKMMAHFFETIYFLFNTSIYFVLLLIAIGSGVLITQKESKLMYLLYYFFILPIIIYTHSVIPFPRTWIYLIVPFLFLIGMVIDRMKINNLIRKVSYFGGAILLIVLLYNSHQKIIQNEFFSIKSQEIAEILIRENAQKIYVEHPLIEANLIYFFEEHSKDIEVTYAYSRNQVNSIDLDYIKSTYDFIIFDEASNFKNLLKDYVNFECNTYLSQVNSN